MKIQCACGSKYAFDVTPEMVRSPVRLVCQNCGADNSTVVNQLIQQQFAAAAPAVAMPGVAAGTTGGAKLAPAPEIAPPPPGARLVPLVAETPAASASAAHIPPPVTAGSGAAPIAPPRVNAPSLRVSVAAHAPAPAAEAHPSAPATPAAPPAAPRYPMPRKKGGEGSYDKLIGRSLAAGFALFFAGLGFWAWYAWVGSVPKAYASLRLDSSANSGQLHVQPDDQVVFLHGSRLVRHDFKTGKELWSVQLIDEKIIEKLSKEEHDRYLAERSASSGADWGGGVVSLEDVIARHKRSATDPIHLYARGEAVWLSFTNKLSRYDWQTGRVTSEVDIIPGDNQFVANGDELLVRQGHDSVLTVNLLSGESKTQKSTAESTPESVKAPATRPGTTPTAGTAQASLTNNPAGRNTARRPVGTINRLAAPAVNAANDNQLRLNAELAGTPAARPSGNRPAGTTAAAPRNSSGAVDSKLIVTRRGTFQVTTKSLGQRMLNGENTSVVATTLKRLGASDNTTWTGDLPQIPDIHALPSATLLTAGRIAVAIDANGKKLWEQRLESHIPVVAQTTFVSETPLRAEGPCVEHRGVIYLADSAGLTALDAASGTQKWRLPCEAPSTMVFDEHGDLYLNIVVSGGGKAEVGVQKIEGATGKPLWMIGREGAATYASGKFLYTIDTYRGDLEGKEGIDAIPTVLDVGPFIRLRRIDMATGKIKWGHVQERFPLDVRIEKNTFQLLFKKEVQLLKFMSF